MRRLVKEDRMLNSGSAYHVPVVTIVEPRKFAPLKSSQRFCESYTAPVTLPTSRGRMLVLQEIVRLLSFQTYQMPRGHDQSKRNPR